MDSIDEEDFIPCGNTAASEAGASSFPAATSQTAARKQGNLFFAKSVLIIWETKIYLLLAPFTLKTHQEPEQHPRRCCQTGAPPSCRWGRHDGEGRIPTSPQHSKGRGPRGFPHAPSIAQPMLVPGVATQDGHWVSMPECHLLGTTDLRKVTHATRVGPRASHLLVTVTLCQTFETKN